MCMCLSPPSSNRYLAQVHRTSLGSFSSESQKIRVITPSRKKTCEIFFLIDTFLIIKTVDPTYRKETLHLFEQYLKRD